MTWFEQITGFAERPYLETQSLLQTDGPHLVSARSPRRWRIGTFESPSLADLEQRADEASLSGRTTFRIVQGDVRALHRDPANANALFQVASQFNALEMIDPSVTPEDGVTRYDRDPTQGPACAIAAGAATIFRNYLMPLPGGIGQTRTRQLDGLADLGAALGNADGSLWRMQNGYALATEEGLRDIARYLDAASLDEREQLKGLLRIGLQLDAEVTDAPEDAGITVSQAFCSALPVRYSSHDATLWEPFARLVLEAAYEATFLAAAVNLRRTGCRTVFLTRLGGGAFGNDDAWIFDAMRGALARCFDLGLDVRLVSYGAVLPEYRQLEADFVGGTLDGPMSG